MPSLSQAAAYQEIKWQRGQLLIEDSHVYVVFPGQDKILLTNLRCKKDKLLQVKSWEVADRKYVVTNYSPREEVSPSIYFTKTSKELSPIRAEGVDFPFFNLAQEPKNGAPLKGVLVGTWMEKGKQFVLLVSRNAFNNLVLSSKTSILLTIDQTSAEKWNVTSGDFLGPVPSGTEIGFGETESGTKILVFDSYSGTFNSFEISSGAISANELGLLPPAGPHEKVRRLAPILEFDPKYPNIFYVPQADGSKIAIKHSDGHIYPDHSSRPTDEEQPVLQIQWAYGLSAARSLVSRGMAEKAYLAPGDMLDTWKTRSLQNIGAIHPDSASKIEIAAIALPRFVSQASPTIAKSITLEALETLAENIDGPMIYMEFPNYPVDEYEIAKILMQVLSANPNPPEKPVFLVVNAFSADPLLYKNLQACLRRVVQSLPEKGHLMNMLVMLPEEESDQCNEEALGHCWGMQSARDLRVQKVSASVKISQDTKLDLIARALVKSGHSLDQKTIAAIVTQVENDTQLTTRPLAGNFMSLARGLEIILKHVQLDPKNPEFLPSVSLNYRKLQGDRSNPAFGDAAVLEAYKIYDKLAGGSPQHEPDPLYGLDAQLMRFQDLIGTWLKEDVATNPTNVITLLGDGGTGKSKLVTRAAAILGMQLEVINITALIKAHAAERQQDPLPSFIAGKIEDAIQKLVLSANPIKGLFIDEFHAFPQLVFSLQGATGDTDKTADTTSEPRQFNLDGFITFLAGNVQVETDAYKKANELKINDAKYLDTVKKLFVDAVSNIAKSLNIDETVVNAVGGRLMSGMIFFPKFGQSSADSEDTEEQGASLFEDVLTPYANRYHAQILVLPDGKAAISKMISKVSGANVRGVKRVMAQRVASAIARFRLLNDGDVMNGGVFIIRPMADSPIDALELVDVGQDEVSGKYIFEDAYQRFATGIKAALSYEIGLLQKNPQDKHRIVLEELCDYFKLFLNAFTVASKRKFTVGELVASALPDWDWKDRAKVIRLSSKIGDRVTRLFENFFKEKGFASHKHEDLNRVVHDISFVLNAVKRVSKAAFDTSSESFQLWAAPMLQAYREDSATISEEKSKKLELGFIESQFEKWQALQKELEEVSTEKKRAEKLAEFWQSLGGELVKLLSKEDQKINEFKIKTFVDYLKNGDAKNARDMIEAMKKKDESLSLGGSGQASSKVLQRELVAISAAYFLDDLARQAASAIRKEKLTTMKRARRKAELERLSQAASVTQQATGPCPQALEIMRQADQEVGESF